MRAGWLLSPLLHAALVGATLIAWPFWRAEERFEAGAVVPVEIVAVAPETNIAPLRAPNVEEVAPELQDEGEPAPAQPPAEAIPELAPAPAPAPRERERPRQQRELDLAELESLLAEPTERPAGRREVRAAPAATETGERPRAGVGARTGMTASLQDRIASLINDQLDRKRCYAPPAGRPNADRLRTRVGMQLDRSGALIGAPRILDGGSGDRAFDEAALRAIRACAPFAFPDDVTALYPAWRDVTLNFDPQNFE